MLPLLMRRTVEPAGQVPLETAAFPLLAAPTVTPELMVMVYVPAVDGLPASTYKFTFDVSEEMVKLVLELEPLPDVGIGVQAPPLLRNSITPLLSRMPHPPEPAVSPKFKYRAAPERIASPNTARELMPSPA